MPLTISCMKRRAAASLYNLTSLLLSLTKLTVIFRLSFNRESVIAIKLCFFLGRGEQPGKNPPDSSPSSLLCQAFRTDFKCLVTSKMSNMIMSSGYLSPRDTSKPCWAKRCTRPCSRRVRLNSCCSPRGWGRHPKENACKAALAMLEQRKADYLQDLIFLLPIFLF